MAKLKMGSIKDGKDKNRFCGPSVISAVTTLSSGEAARLIRKQTGRKAVTGTSTWEVKKALEACNVKMNQCRYPSTFPTLAAWLRLSKQDRTTGRIFLIVAGHHWQLVSGRRYTCGRVREIISIRDKRVKRRARVSEVYELISDNVIKPEIDVAKPKDPNASVRAKAHRIAKEIGAEIVTHGSHDSYKEVYPPSWLYEKNDPYEGEHMVYDWQEVLVMVKEYKKIVEQYNIVHTE
jgi:hypothetical protein